MKPLLCRRPMCMYMSTYIYKKYLYINTYPMDQIAWYCLSNLMATIFNHSFNESCKNGRKSPLSEGDLP